MSNIHPLQGVAPPTPADGRNAGRLYAGYVLFILFLANMASSIDRSIVNILVEPIRLDLGLNDTEMGAVGGLGFALFYGLLGIPIARLADRGNRVRLLSIGIAVWSLMTVVTGKAMGFWSLLLSRIGVGAGEATCYPTALSLIGDYFAPAQRPRAIGLFQLGVHAGIIVGAAVAGVLAESHGWRVAFYALGAPGLLLAVLVLLTVREPTRGRMEAVTIAAPTKSAFGVVFAQLITNRPFLLLVMGSTFMSLAAATLANWGAAYLIRSHGLSQSEVGLAVGPVLGLGGAVGTILGGFVGTWVAQRSSDPYAPLKVILFTALPAAPFMTLFLLAPTLQLALIGGFLGGVLTAMHYGPLIAVAIGLAPVSSRAAAAALLLLGQTVIGFALGPLIAGALSDLLSSTLGAESLRYGMLIAPVCVLAAWVCALLARRALTAGR